MSRLGKKPIAIINNAQVKIEGGEIIVKGPKGELKLNIHPAVLIKQEGENLDIKVKNENDKKQLALWGTYVRLIKNMMQGVTIGFDKKLQLIGVGFRAQVTGQKLILNIGFSHQVEYEFPKNITISVEKDIITIFGADKQLVGEIAAQIRKIKKPEPYKGSGIRYFGEVVKKKAGKKAVASGGA
ncbi:MAG: 50S ribosomal protein L6 [Patescibacteria group bacterium]|nr:50S ribosomal protein L6 [Patescibacteria group bacterium]MDD5121040.1 50S ribosomal protein L6 [Patescibacteria group bacterium]MDD5221599.1 50S ribosomal protein L6 [Patescibacteria group bacterium]MDD5396041.1 50S ribosomal protein L6 [Patescibacteria group bacterium]